MKPDVTDKLAESQDFNDLARAVLDLCKPYGPVHALHLTHNRGSARVACAIELESQKQQMALARDIGARLNGSVRLEIPVGRDFGGEKDLPPAYAHMAADSRPGAQMGG
jgi:hypothetical protein